jgi:3-hydroxyacyl-CoA dehydrogenase
MATPESKGLRHALSAERAAGKVDGITPSTPVRPLDQAAVIGAGTMGAGISVALLDAGIPLWLVEADQAALDRGLARIAGTSWRSRVGDLAERSFPADHATSLRPSAGRCF